jgi:3-oxoacyl-[acyl-carrier protein] reductase
MGFFDLTGQTAMVTGAATGIGEAIARRLACAGATVAAADVDGEGAAQAAQTIVSEGRQAFAVPLDITSAASAAQAVAAILARTGRIDILVNNAGVAGKAAPLWEQTDEDWQRVLAVNLTGVFTAAGRSSATCASAATDGSSMSPPSPARKATRT